MGHTSRSIVSVVIVDAMVRSPDTPRLGFGTIARAHSLPDRGARVGAGALTVSMC